MDERQMGSKPDKRRAIRRWLGNSEIERYAHPRIPIKHLPTSAIASGQKPSPIPVWRTAKIV